MRTTTRIGTRDDGGRWTVWAGAVALAVLALALLARGALAQAEAPFDLTGTVVGEGGQPLVGALVTFAESDWGTITDAEGEFRLRDVLPGRVQISVEQLGYADRRWEGVVGPASGPVTIRMEPRAVMLEGLDVVVDRFESRRKAYPRSSRAWDREDLATTAYSTMRDFIQGRGGVFLTDCGRVSTFTSTCVWYRGSRVAPSIYVDEAPMFGGMEYLDMVRPWEVQKVEIYGRGTHIRVYTTHFMERAARTRLQPVAFVTR